MKWNRSHNDRSPRLCVSPRRRPHVTAVCPTVVCKFLYYYILLIILSSIFISTLLNIIPDSLVTLHQGLLRTFVQEFLRKILFLYYRTNIIRISRDVYRWKIEKKNKGVERKREIHAVLIFKSSKNSIPVFFVERRIDCTCFSFRSSGWFPNIFSLAGRIV